MSHSTAAMLRHSGSEPRDSRIFYGWVMAPIGMMLSICTTPGQSVGVAAFNLSLRSDLHLSASQLAGAYALGTILASFILPFAGAAMDRFGIRRTLAWIVPAFGLACFYISTVSTLIWLFAAFFLLRFLGQGALSLASQNTLAMWFDQRLGRVAGITTTFVTLCMAASPLLFRSSIESFGWRATYRGLGFTVVLLLLPLLAVYRNRPEDVGQLPDGRTTKNTAEPDSDHSPEIEGMNLSQALQEKSYWILIFLSAVWSLIGTSLIFDVQSLGQSMLGASILSTSWGSIPVEAANTCFFGGVALMTFVGGFLADRYSPTRLLRVALFGMLCGLLLTWLGNGVGFFTAYCVYGLAQGLLIAVSRTVWPRFFGRAHLGKIQGGSMTAMVAGSSVGPLFMGFASDLTGSFQIPLITYAALTAAGLYAAWQIRPPAKTSHVVGTSAR